MSQLWLGPDHLLHVTSTGYTESYRRFYLRDIQSMIVVHTGRRLFLHITLAILLLLALLITSTADGGPVAYGVILAVFLPFFIWNHVLGPGCEVVLKSAVQQETIRALSRLPKTRRILSELRPRIEAAQATLPAAPPPAPPGGAAGPDSSEPPPLPTA